MTTTNKTTKPKQNVFDEEITSVYQIEVAPSRRNVFEVDIELVNEDEQYMLDRLHTQAVAVSGRAAVAKFTTSHVGEMATHAAYMMTGAMEQVNRIESAAQVGRFEKPMQNFHNRLLDDTSRYIAEVNGVAIRQMYKDTTTDIYPERKAPAPSKRKGVFRNIKEFFAGEE